MNTNKIIYIAAISSLLMGFTSCEDEDGNPYPDGNGAVSVSKVFLLDASDTTGHKEREVEFARLGQTLRLEGSGFGGTTKVLVNGYETYFNTALTTDNSMIFSLSGTTPVAGADESVRNKIQFVKSSGTYSYDFVIRAASPKITSISPSIPKPGETVKVSGVNLEEVSEVTLPGGISVSENIVNAPEDESGEWFTFVMPEGVSENGTITITGANGQAISGAYFNDFDCFITDFDGNGELGGWSATWKTDDLVDDPLNTGRGKVAMLIPHLGEADAKYENGINPGVDHIEFWATAGNDNANDDWTRMTSKIPAETSLTELAIQFDIYVDGVWNETGQLEISLANNLNSYGYGSANASAGNSGVVSGAAVWIPWFDKSNPEVLTPYTTESWQTVTIPFTEFGEFADGEAHTFQEVIDLRNSSSYKNFLVFASNANLKYGSEEGQTIEAKVFNTKIYLDNFRVVNTKSTTVSDF